MIGWRAPLARLKLAKRDPRLHFGASLPADGTNRGYCPFFQAS